MTLLSERERERVKSNSETVIILKWPDCSLCMAALTNLIAILTIPLLNHKEKTREKRANNAWLKIGN